MSRLVDRITKGPFLREGNTIYALVQDGWRKGKEVFKNRVAVHVQPDKDCPQDEADADAELVVSAFNVAHQSGRSPAELLADVESLRAEVGFLTECREALKLDKAQLMAERGQLRTERNMERARLETAIDKLSAIYALLWPPVFTTETGQSFAFRPKDLDANSIMQELSDRIRSIPESLAKLEKTS